MKNNQSLKINFLYNITYQIFVLLIPFITAPYVSRVLGVNGIGTYSYKYSFVYYFMLLVLLGVNNYGNRSIAKVRNNETELSKTFWSIYILQIMNGMFMILIYAIYLLIFSVNYIKISIIMVLFIISSMFDVNWLFFGLEQFKKTVTRNIVIKLLSIILIFTFVKNPNDLWIYTLIMGGTTLLSQLVLWPYILKKIKFKKISFCDIKKHIVPNLILFIPVLAVSIYKIMDKIMLGMMTNMIEVGLYENAEKMITIPFTIITALGTVMLPRMSYIVSNGDINKLKEYILKSTKFVIFLSLPMFLGLVSIGNDFAPIFFGHEFEKSGILIVLLSVTLPFLSFANVLRTQFLIPNERDKEYIISVAIGALINLIFNLIFIPMFLSVGACIGTIAAEISVVFFQSFALRNEINIFMCLKNIFQFLIKSFIMFLIIYPINFLSISEIIKILLKIIFGITVYTILNYKYIFKELGVEKVWKKHLLKRKI